MAVGTIGVKSAANLIVPISNLMKRTKEVALTVTSAQAGWATTRAVGIFYADSAGVWRLRFNISGAFNSASISSITVSLTNVVFKAATNNYQAVSAMFQGASTLAIQSAFATHNTADISIYVTPANTVSGLSISGDVELNAEPTTYTTAANMENVANISAFIPCGQAGMPGEVKETTLASISGTNSTSYVALSPNLATPTLTAGSYIISAQMSHFLYCVLTAGKSSECLLELWDGSNQLAELNIMSTAYAAGDRADYKFSTAYITAVYTTTLSSSTVTARFKIVNDGGGVGDTTVRAGAKIRAIRLTP